MKGASCAVREPARGVTRNGQPNITRPNIEATARAQSWNGCAACATRRFHAERLDDLVHREPSRRLGRIFATWGANAGDDRRCPRSGRRRRPRLRRARPLGRRSPATNSTSWVATTMAWPAAARSLEDRREPLLGSRSRGRGSARRAGARRGAAASCTASTNASRCPSDRSRGWASDGTPTSSRSSSSRHVPAGAAMSASAWPHSSATVGGRAGRRELAAPGRCAPGASTVPIEPGARALQRPQQRRLARAVATHERDDLAGAEVEIDLAHRDRAAVAHDEPTRPSEHRRRSCRDAAAVGGTREAEASRQGFGAAARVAHREG